MSSERKEKLYRRIITDIKIAGIGAMALAASLDIAMFDSNAAELSAISGGIVFVIGATAAILDGRRYNRHGDSPPDDDPEKEDIDTGTEVITLHAAFDLLKNEQEAA